MPDAVEVELLPALPEQWSEGSIEGVHIRGGATIDMRWKAGKIVSMEVHAKSNGAIRMIPPQGQAVAGTHTPACKPLLAGKDGAIRLVSGTSYVIAFH
jgi:alpha-L-fucosidase 2